MQFSDFNRVEEGNKITFYTANPLKGITDIKYYRDNAIGNFSKKEFRWSFNGDYWSSWTPLNQGNISMIKIGGNPYLFLEIRYFSSGNGKISLFTLYYDGETQNNIECDTCPPDSKYKRIDKTIDTDTYIPGESCNKEYPIDATTLCGKSGEYYLWRPNHKGQQPISSITDLQKILNNLSAAITNVDIKGALNVDGSGVGVYYGRIDSSIGTELLFKRIDASGFISVSETSTGRIIISGDASLAGNITYQNSNPTIKSVGGIQAGSTYFLTPKTFSQVMEDMFYPLSFPTLTDPYNTLNSNIPSPKLVIIGTKISLSLTSTLNRGSINPAYGTNGYRSGPGMSVHFNGPDVSVVIGSYPSSPYTYTISNYEVSLGIQTWNSYWDVSDGQQPLDSKGNPYSSPYPSQSLPSASTSLEGVYPIYATTEDITILTQQPLQSMINGDHIEIQMVAEPPFGTDRQKFDLPTLWIQSRPLVSIQFYSYLEQAWKYEGGSAASSLTYWTVSNPGDKIIQGKSVPYTRYSYSPLERQGAVLYRLNFS